MNKIIVLLICCIVISIFNLQGEMNENSFLDKRRFSFGISICSNYIYHNDIKFIVKGVSYNPYFPSERNGDNMRKADFDKDLKMIKDANINTILLYWQRPKRIYQACRELNLKIIQGIPIQGDIQDFQNSKLKKNIKKRIRYIVDYINENNFSDAVLAYFIGGEIDPFNIKTSNIKNQNMGTYNAKHFLCDQKVNSAESFLLEMADYLREYELSTYSNTHLISHINWPSSDEDLNIDFLDVAFFDIYSYWPDKVAFFNAGSYTETSYQGYLESLKQQYSKTPLVISEFGYPTAPLDDIASVSEMVQAKELINRWIDIITAKHPIAGGNVFEWNDEWWKQAKAAESVSFSLDPQYHEKDDYEEWFGIMSVDGQSYEDYEYRPKPAYNAVKKMYEEKFNPEDYYKELRMIITNNMIVSNNIDVTNSNKQGIK